MLSSLNRRQILVEEFAHLPLTGLKWKKFLMLSLLTYGATFGVAGAASTRHEFEKLDQHKARNQAIDSDGNNLSKLPKSNAIEPSASHQTEFQAEQEQYTTKGGAIGWLKRLIWDQI